MGNMLLGLARQLFRNQYTLVAVTTVAIFTHSIATNSWFLEGEMWAESATNYFRAAHEFNFVTALLAPDSGYLAVPQRLLASMGVLLGMNASETAFFYNYIGVALAAFFSASITFRRFRGLIPSDAVRAFIAFLIVAIADFESKTFINFSYFAVIPILFLAAELLQNREAKLPKHSWLLLFFFLSKPALMATLPGLLLVGAARRGKVLIFGGVGVVFSALQILMLTVSQTQGVYQPGVDYSLIEKLQTSALYYPALLGGFLTKPFASSVGLNELVGCTALGLAIWLIFRNGLSKSALIVVGSMALGSNVLLNSFALSDSWNLGLGLAGNPPIYRHVMVAFVGAIMVYVGVLQAVTARFRLVEAWALRVHFTPILVGVMAFASLVSAFPRAPSFPMVHNSQWQAMSSRIDSGFPVCVPLDPLGWVYGGCRMLQQGLDSGRQVDFLLLLEKGSTGIDISAPKTEDSATLVSFAVVTKLSDQPSGEVVMTARVFYIDGSHETIVGTSATQTRALANFVLSKSTSIDSIERISISSNTKMLIGTQGAEDLKPAIMWLVR